MLYCNSNCSLTVSRSGNKEFDYDDDDDDDDDSAFWIFFIVDALYKFNSTFDI